MADDHGNCPHCGSDMNGGSVWQTFFEKHGAEEADRIAAQFGATRTSGQWGRAIGIYDIYKDRVMHHRCPDCRGEW